MNTMIDSQRENQLRQGFKNFNRFMLALWRLGLGAWVNAAPSIGGRVMVITHIGRKSGAKRRTPVNYALVHGEVYCTAGFGETSDWYRNITANPEIEVWLPDGWWRGLAEEITDPSMRIFLMRQVLIGSGFAAYAAGLNPHEMSDMELQVATETYRLVHIQRTSPCTGPGGPGDLAWVWPLATMILLPLALRRKR